MLEKELWSFKLSSHSTSLHPTNLRCEHLKSPLGLNTLLPRLNWSIEGVGRVRSWRIIASEKREEVEEGLATIWDSGKIFGGVTSCQWGGAPLIRDQRIWWAVQLWDEASGVVNQSSVASFFTGLDSSDWRGDWIGRYFVLPDGRDVPQDTIYDNVYQARPADYMRKVFRVGNTPVRAYLYISALGLYKVSINGKQVTDAVMAPGWTDYHQRVEYQTFDVIDELRKGNNVIGVVLGEGWYSGRIGHNQRRAGNHYGGRPSLKCQLHIEYADGCIAKICSDGSWHTKQGPICYSDFLAGEMYDARLELGNWLDENYSEQDWQPVEAFIPEPKAPILDASRVQLAKEVARLESIAEHISPAGEVVYNFGQNLAGYVELKVAAPKGTVIKIRHAERLDEQGNLYVDNLRYAVSEDIFICNGQGVETFKPSFTFHGFQYAGLTLPNDASVMSIRSIAIQTDVPVCGEITTGNRLVNQLLSNIFWSQRGNFLSVPTDCPQRDERYGWSADAQVFWRTAGYFMDVSAFLCKWIEDLIDGQSSQGEFPDVAPTKPLNPYRLTPQPGAPAWGDAPIIMAWHHYLRYGDEQMLRRCWEPFNRWMAFIERENPNFLRAAKVHNNYGDWLSIGADTDRVLINTAYWAHLAWIMARIADVIGQESRHWHTLRSHITDAFQNTFLSLDGRLKGDTQTAYLLALDFGLIPKEKESVVASHLNRLLSRADGHLQTGFLGIRHLCPVISQFLSAKQAVDLLLNESYPSWGFSIKHGATSIWERWDGWTPDKGFQSTAMNSFNHYAYGAVGEWIWSRLAGIDWSESKPGFKEVLMRPIFDERIGFVDAVYESGRGKVKSHWYFSNQDEVIWEVYLPPETSAKVELMSPWMRDQEGSFELASGVHRMKITKI